jgi:hypothetical protein
MLEVMNASTLHLAAIFGVGACALVVAACSSSKTNDTPALVTSTAAAVSGAPDTHCGAKTVVAMAALCNVKPDAGDGDAGSADGGADGGAAADDNEFGETLSNSEGDDDDCKYHVKWESTAVAENTDITFKITVVNKGDQTPAAGAKPYIEAFLDTMTPAPNSPSEASEIAPGVYTIGPNRFDKPGNWTVRFHLFGDCIDSEQSPHGHAAFYVKVP